MAMIQGDQVNHEFLMGPRVGVNLAVPVAR